MVNRTTRLDPTLVIIPVDAEMRGMSGHDLMERLTTVDHRHPAIMITGHGDLPIAVHVTRASDSNFFGTLVDHQELLASIEGALKKTPDANKRSVARDIAATHFGGLTARQREIVDLVLAGHRSKDIAAILGISQRTVENHRAAVMKRTGSKSLATLIRLALGAT